LLPSAPTPEELARRRQQLRQQAGLSRQLLAQSED
jgi:hypothetical protein